MEPNTAKPLNIGWSDLESPDTIRHAEGMKAAQAVPLVRNVGAPRTEKRAWYRGQLVQLALAGLMGGLLAWLLIEVITQPDNSDRTDDPTISNILFTMILGFSIGIVLASWDGIQARSWSKIGNSLKWAVPILIGTTLVGGIVANAVYSAWIESIVETAILKAQSENWTETQALAYLQGQIHLPRGVAWSIVGLSAGLGIGLSTRRPQRIVNGAIGGLIGGFLGGVLFDFFTSGTMARIFGIALTGLTIGIAVGLVEIARRQHWLEIASGGMAGKQFILYGDRTSVGSGPDNDVTLIKDPNIGSTQVVLTVVAESLQLTSVDPQHATLVNGTAVQQQTLRDGDTVQLGSTLVVYRSRQSQQPVAGPIAG